MMGKGMMITLVLYFIKSVISEKDIFIFNHFRHGARGPLSLNEEGKDGFGNFWSSPGELTNVGVRMHYLLGVHKRLKYKEFLSEVYDPREIYVVSSDINRTIQSALSQLQGLYPPSTGSYLSDNQIKHSLPPLRNTSILNDEIKRLNHSSLPKAQGQIPVHIYSRLENKILLHEPRFCPHMALIKENNKKSNSIVKEVSTKFNKTYGERLLKFFGITDNKDYFADISNLNVFSDEYLSDYTDQRDLSEFEKAGFNLKEIYDQCKILTQTVYKDYIYGDERRDVVFMALSPILRDMITFMTVKVKDVIANGTEVDIQDYSKPKFVMVSGHDSTLCGIELFFKEIFHIKEYINPVYASDIEIKVIEKDGAENKSKKTFEDFDVSYSFNGKHIHRMPFTEFKEKIESKLWTEREIVDYCYNYEEDDVKLMKKLLYGLSGVSLIFVVTLIVSLLRKRS